MKNKEKILEGSEKIFGDHRKNITLKFRDDQNKGSLFRTTPVGYGPFASFQGTILARGTRS